MANTTVRGALAIHGQNPQVTFQSSLLRCFSSLSVSSRDGHSKPHIRVAVLERALLRSYRYVFSSCEGRNTLKTSPAETLIDRAIELKAIGGVYGPQKPTEFISLLLKLLQIQPEKEILIEYLQADEFKLAVRLIHLCQTLTGQPSDI